MDIILMATRKKQLEKLEAAKAAGPTIHIAVREKYYLKYTSFL